MTVIVGTGGCVEAPGQWIASVEGCNSCRGRGADLPPPEPGRLGSGGRPSDAARRSGAGSYTLDPAADRERSFWAGCILHGAQQVARMARLQ